MEISEAAATLFGIQVADRHNFGLVHIEGDALIVISAISNRLEGSSPINLFFDHMFSLIKSFFGFHCNFVKRHGNTLDHSIARWDIGVANEKICMAPFPQLDL